LNEVEYPDNDQTVIIGEEVKDIIGEMRWDDTANTQTTTEEPILTPNPSEEWTTT
jgi:hypothetical protein